MPEIPAIGKKPGKVVGVVDFCKILGCNRQRFYEWSEAGMPTVKEGRTLKADVGKAVRWKFEEFKRELVGEPGTGSENGDSEPLEHPTIELAKLNKARREKVQREIAMMDGDLLAHDEVAHEWSAMVVAARSKFLALGAKLAQRLAAKTDPAEIKQLIDKQVRRALDEMAERPVTDASGPTNP